jgi:hypothetical protein
VVHCVRGRDAPFDQAWLAEPVVGLTAALGYSVPGCVVAALAWRGAMQFRYASDAAVQVAASFPDVLHTYCNLTGAEIVCSALRWPPQ